MLLQEELKTKDGNLQEKEVVIQKLKNNLNNREGELKVNSVLEDKHSFIY